MSCNSDQTMAKLSAATAETHTLTAAEKKAAKLSAAETPTSTAAEKKAAKMSSSNNDELVKFLISCIRHGVNGKVITLVLHNSQSLY